RPRQRGPGARVDGAHGGAGVHDAALGGAGREDLPARAADAESGHRRPDRCHRPRRALQPAGVRLGRFPRRARQPRDPRRGRALGGQHRASPRSRLAGDALRAVAVGDAARDADPRTAGLRLRSRAGGPVGRTARRADALLRRRRGGARLLGPGRGGPRSSRLHHAPRPSGDARRDHRDRDALARRGGDHLARRRGAARPRGHRPRCDRRGDRTLRGPAATRPDSPSGSEGDDVNIRPNRVKQKLAAGEVALVLSGTNDPDLIDQLGPLHPDGIWLEGEHGGVDYADLGNLTRACDLWGMTSVVRVMDNDYATIYRTLDRGAQGIVVPHVNTRAEAEAVVEAGKFAPLGKRGMFTSRQGFGVGDYLKAANDQSLLIVLIEDIVAVKHLDEILKVDHIDVFFVAPGDLATSMGQIGNMGHPEVQKTIDGALSRIVQAGRTAGMLVNTANVERYTRLGVRALMTSFFPWVQSGVKELAERAAAGARG